MVLSVRQTRIIFPMKMETPFNPVGTTSHAWHLKYDGDIAASMKVLKTSGFNKVRFSIFPRHNEYSLDDPTSLMKEQP